MTFLEETFALAPANPKHRLHQKAAQAVLKALLPQPAPTSRARCGRSRAARGLGLCRPSPRLRRPDPHPRPRAAADHADRPRGMRPTRVRQSRPASDRVLPAHPRLPGPLAARLADPQAAGDARGRAELRLAERAALWNAKPENRHLPSVLEWANIRAADQEARTGPSRSGG